MSSIIITIECPRCGEEIETSTSNVSCPNCNLPLDIDEGQEMEVHYDYFPANNERGFVRRPYH